MADSTVHITGSESGAFTAAYDDLPAWATEGTLSTIHGILVKSLKAQESSLKELSKLLKKAAVKGGGGGTDPEVKKYLASMAKSAEAADKFKEELDKANKAAQARTDQENKSATSIANWSLVLSNMANVGNKALAIQKQYITTSTDMYNSGVNLVAGQADGVTSMQSLNQMVAITGIRLENLQKVVEKYSTSVNAVGMLKFTKAVAKSSTSLTELGYNSIEQAELMGTMIEAQSSYSDIRGKSEKQMSNDAVQLGAKIRELSLTYGMSTTALKENFLAVSKSTDSMAIGALYGDAAANSFNTFAAGIKDSGGRDMMQKLGASMAPEATKTYQMLAKAGLGDMGDEMTRIAKLSMSDSVAAGKQLSTYAQTLDPSKIIALQLQAEHGNEAAASMLQVINGQRQQFLNESKATGKQVAGAMKGGKSVAALATEQERTASLTQVAFPALESSIDALTATMKGLNDAAMPLAKGIGSTVGNFLSSTAVVVGFTAQIALTILSLRSLNSAVKAIAGMAQGQGGPGAAGGRAGGGKMGKFGGAAGAAGAVGGLAMNYAGGMAQEAGYTKTGAALEIGGSALSGASMGAMIGSVIPGLGTIIGGAVGGAVGTAIGAYQNWDTLTGGTKEPKQSTIDSASDVAAKAKMTEAKDESAISSTPSPATTDKATGAGGINTIMAQQVGILDQILVGTTKLVSINNEILRVSRTHS